jgi:DNA-binding winged helix-turn-helix (wHTH) protein
LVASPGRLVTRDALTAAIWGDGTHVKFDDGLNYCVRQLRAALGDDARSPRFIETIPRRGYRFIAGVGAPATATLRSRWVSVAAAAVVFAGAMAWLESRPNNHHEMAVNVTRAIHDALY